MLEHAGEPVPDQTPLVGDASLARDYYVPPHHAEPLTGQAKAPSVKRFNPKMIAGMAVMGATVIAAAFAVGLQQTKKKPLEAMSSNAKPPVPNEAVNALPSTYSDGVPVLGEPRNGDVGALSGPASRNSTVSPPKQLSPLEQYAQQTELNRLRDEDRARIASVAFANTSGIEASTAASTVGSGATGQEFQERLLDIAQHAGTAPGANPSNASAHDDASRQEDKTEFAERSRGTDFRLHETLQVAHSPNILFAGTLLPCVLTQGINSDLPGQIGCLVSQNVYDTVTGDRLLVPQGTKALGTYDSRVVYGQERVLVVWTRLLRPDGSTLSLEGMPGVDLSGYAGLTGHVNNHYGRLLSGVVLGSLIGASAQIAVGANSQNPTFAQLAIQGAGQNVNEAGQQITRKNLNIQPTIEVRPGTRLNIFTTKDLVLPPWTPSSTGHP